MVNSDSKIVVTSTGNRSIYLSCGDGHCTGVVYKELPIIPKIYKRANLVVMKTTDPWATVTFFLFFAALGFWEEGGGGKLLQNNTRISKGKLTINII